MTGIDNYTPKSAMIVVAHPDDAEFIAAGTVAKWSNAGSHVTYVVVTKGDKGSDDPEVTQAGSLVFRTLCLWAIPMAICSTRWS